MRIDNYRGWDDEALPNPGAGVPLPMPPTFDSSTLLGVDISHFQDVVDFAKLKAAGVNFVFIKATEGIDLLDQQFAANWQKAKAFGFPRGAYHLFRPKDDLQSQIDFFVKTVGRPQPGDLPPVLDVEVPEDWTQFTVAQRVNMILGWLKGVEAALGVRPIIYINNSMTNTVLSNPAAFAAYLLWIAHYTSHPTPALPLPWTSWVFWQYSETGDLGGLTGGVDLDRFNGTLADLQRLQFVGLVADDTTFVGRLRGWLRRLREWLGL